MVVDKNDLVTHLHKLDHVLDRRYSLVAAGGTALTLYGVKQNTLDIDFVVADGDIRHLKETCSGIGLAADLFFPGIVYVNPLPPDYISMSSRFGSFINITLYALNKVDIILTKIGRLNDKDLDDIRACMNHGVSWQAVANRYTQYNPAPDKKKTRNILCEIFDAPEDCI